MGEFDGIKEREEGKSKMPLAMAVLFMVLILFGLSIYVPVSSADHGMDPGGPVRAPEETQKKAVITHEVKEVASGASEGGKADKGPEIYKSDCAMCHGEDLEGGIGPALRGPKFIYGGTLADHARVVADGTPNGMPAFGKQLGAEKVRAVAHYIFFRHTK